MKEDPENLDLGFWRPSELKVSLVGCPFCYNKNQTLMLDDVDHYFVLCPGCGSSSGRHWDAEVIVKGWNTRI